MAPKSRCKSAPQARHFLIVTGQLLPDAGVDTHGRTPQSSEYCSGSHIKESNFRFIDLSLALALNLGRGLRRIVARVRGVLGHLPHTVALWLAVASRCCSN